MSIPELAGTTRRRPSLKRSRSAFAAADVTRESPAAWRQRTGAGTAHFWTRAAVLRTRLAIQERLTDAVTALTFLALCGVVEAALTRTAEAVGIEAIAGTEGVPVADSSVILTAAKRIARADRFAARRIFASWRSVG
jgi:hypothetical protein